MRVGFACAWTQNPERTNSGTPWGLRRALRRQTDVADLGVEYSPAQTALKYAYARRRRGRWGSVYRWSRLWDLLVEGKLRVASRAQKPDAVIEVGDLARLDAPFYVYQDLSFDVLARYYDTAYGVPGFDGIDRRIIERRRERQHEIYEAAAGVFAMSEWFADTLTQWSGVPREKVVVAYAGLNAVGEEPPKHVPEHSPGSPPRLLLVGRDFFRKGGESVVEALARLRREYAPDTQLTVAGPARWPMSGGVPEGVEFLGDLGTVEVARLYREHDLFVMPSRFEGFGIVFREALANGLPVIAREAFAMTEIIEPGKNGALVKTEDPDELAATIVSVLEDPEIRPRTVRAAAEIRERFSWDAVARRMLATIADSTQPSTPAHTPEGE